MSYGTVQAEKLTTESGYSLGAGNASSFKNRLINGAMTIDQRNAGASITPVDSGYTLDRWKYYCSQASKFTCQQNAGSVTPPAGFKNYLGYTVASAYSVGVSDYFVPVQLIEGLNVYDLNWGSASAVPITISFWVRSSLTGTFSGSVINSANNRSYVFTYTINSANTWEQKSVTITGDTSGTWLTTNGNGLELRFCLGVGNGTYSQAAGSWGTGNAVGVSTSVSVVGTAGATWYMTGVQIELGTVATSFDFRSIGTELALCQRYFFQVSSTNAANGENAGITGLSNGSNEMQRTNMTLPVTMRATPTISVSNVKGTGTDLRAYNGSAVQNVTALGSQRSTPDYFQADWTLAGTFSPNGQYLSVLWQDSVNGGYIRASAEL